MVVQSHCGKSYFIGNAQEIVTRNGLILKEVFKLSREQIVLGSTGIEVGGACGLSLAIAPCAIERGVDIEHRNPRHDFCKSGHHCIVGRDG